MIAVIADDFTGAAELAGISLRYGLSVTVCLDNEIDTNADADVVIVCTDSRSMQKAAAIYCTADAVEALLKYEPSLWYKKIDSVLRGYVIDEAKVQMELSEKNKAFICPANPSLQRTISKGEYFISGKKITATDFINDPEFPIGSAKVTAMVNDETVQVLQHDDWLPVEGIVIGEAESTEDIKAWAAATDDSWMLIGAGDFYTALLEKNYQAQPQQKCQLQSPHLYVCGTAFEERKAFIKKTGCCAYLPETIDEHWLQHTCSVIKEKGKAVIAIDESNQSALALRTAMAKAVREIVVRENVKEIFIEGGSTAAAVLEELNIKKLTPVNELSRGVVRMKAGDVFITVKPGSYKLPGEIVKLYQ
ncbi:four-carbon acid sugar kinase family protein [Ferruginibacter sp. SUN106]|uniref:four-carbon acid sugar kinase family protein n=1 Tax=Ferruginibacter sp. SUN106 TaxID=2978348 RepID=UPI003D35CB8D